MGKKKDTNQVFWTRVTHGSR